MNHRELSELLQQLIRQTRVTHAELGEELSEEKAVDYVKSALDVVWPDYLDREIRRALQLPVPKTSPEWQDDADEE